MELKRCLIVDTETTGLDSKVDGVIEIGAVLYSIKNGGALHQASALIPSSIGNGAEEINKISNDLIREAGEVKVLFKSIFTSMVEASDVILAHNAEFDKDFLTKMDLMLWSSKPWLCTRQDFKFGQGKQGDSLVNLTLAHGLGVASAHRALTDCQNLARVFDTYTATQRQDLFKFALLPREEYVAQTSFDQRALPKARGFQWDANNKVWRKRLTEAEALDITEFRIRKVVVSAGS